MAHEWNQHLMSNGQLASKSKVADHLTTPQMLLNGFLTRHINRKADQHLITINAAGAISSYELTTDNPIRRYGKVVGEVAVMQMYNSKTHNCAIVMGHDESSSSETNNDVTSQRSALSSGSSREVADKVSVMKLVYRDTGKIIKFDRIESKHGELARETRCFCIPAAHLNKQGLKRVGGKFANMYIHSMVIGFDRQGCARKDDVGSHACLLEVTMLCI
jgi:hypothetical protein